MVSDLRLSLERRESLDPASEVLVTKELKRHS
jgi:hypothetical protein